MMKKRIYSFGKILTLPVLFAWFLTTIFVDIIAVPAVFRNVSKVEEAGRVGMRVFSAFNSIELVLSLFFVLGSVAIYKKYANKLFLIFSLILFLWALSYNFYFTPQIIHYTKLIRSALPGDAQLALYQDQHTFYHHLYRYLDTTKLIMLIFMMILTFKIELSEEK